MRCNVVIEGVLAGGEENYSSFLLAIGWSPLLGLCWLEQQRVGIWRDNVVKEALRNRNAGFRCIFKQYLLLISGSEVLVLFLPDFCLENPDFLVELSDTIDFLDLDLEYDLDSDFLAD
jgi:hypothetical protein